MTSTEEILDAEIVEDVDEGQTHEQGQGQTRREQGQGQFGSGRRSPGQAVRDAAAARYERARTTVTDPGARAAFGQARRESARLAADGLRGRRLRRREQETLAEYRERGDPDAPVREDLRSHYERALDRRAKAAADQSEQSPVEDYLRIGAWVSLGAGEFSCVADLLGTAPPGPLAAFGVLTGIGNLVIGPFLWRRLKREGQTYRDKLAARAAVDEVTVEGNLPVRPISEAPHETHALELLRRSLLAQGIPCQAVSGQQTPWGWELTMQHIGGAGKRPGDVIKALELVETDLDVRQNGVLVQPHRDRRAKFTARIIESDPFAAMPPLPDYQPGSRTLSSPIELGKRLDGLTLSSTFLATHGIVLAVSGGGKSGMLRTIVDGLAATTDTILWDLDPSGVGQAPQAEVMGRRALSPEDCERALEKALQIAEARTRIKDRLGMGDEWQPSRKHPALVLLLDEYPRLSKAGKELAVALLRVARKAGVVLLFASQSAKKDALGDSIAGEVAWKAGGPGLPDYQTRLLFGEKCVAEGWNPGAFKPKRGQNLNDTGTFFLEGAIEGDEPIPLRATFIGTDTARSRAKRSAAHGRPDWDGDTLTAAGLTREQLTGVTDDGEVATAQRTAYEADQARARLGPLAVVADYLDADLDADDGREFIPSAELVEELGYRSQKALAAELGPLGLTPSQGYWIDEDGTRKETRGYRTADINAAIARLQTGQTSPDEEPAAA